MIEASGPDAAIRIAAHIAPARVGSVEGRPIRESVARAQAERGTTGD